MDVNKSMLKSHNLLLDILLVSKSLSNNTPPKKQNITEYHWNNKIDLPFSCFRRLRLLHILTAHIDKIMATIKNNIPPTTPAVIALCLTRAGTGNLTSSLDSKFFNEFAITRK